MKRSLLLSLALVAVGALLLAAEINVTGAWDMTRTTQRGPTTVTITFAQTGENLTVKMPGRNGEEMTGTGTIKGNELEWTITRTGPQGEMKLTYKAKVDGDKMTGTTQVGERPAMEWTAVKKAK
ncbi:MAG: hypothetical protein ABR951_00785 [Candidatus Aminicenantales bacterium]|jgi:hypothetical protein